MSYGHFIHPILTPKRLAYLRAVEAAGVYEPRHACAANHCLALGWVESVIRTPDGREIAWDDLPPGPDRWSGVEHIGQRLTEDGRKMLALAA